MPIRDNNSYLIIALEEEGFYARNDFLGKTIIDNIKLEIYSYSENNKHPFRIIIDDRIFYMELDDIFPQLKKKDKMFLFLIEQFKVFFKIAISHGFVLRDKFIAYKYPTLKIGNFEFCYRTLGDKNSPSFHVKIFDRLNEIHHEFIDLSSNKSITSE